MLDFVEAVRDGRTPTVSGDDGLHGVLVAERAYESAAGGGVELALAEGQPVR